MHDPQFFIPGRITEDGQGVVLAFYAIGREVGDPSAALATAAMAKVASDLEDQRRRLADIRALATCGGDAEELLRRIADLAA